MSVAVDASLPASKPRAATCPRCAQVFDCAAGESCWCAAEPYRLPCPKDGDCYCPACLRAIAAAQK